MRQLWSALAAMSLFVGACGSPAVQQSSSAPQEIRAEQSAGVESAVPEVSEAPKPSEAPKVAAAQSIIPAINVVNLADDSQFALDSLVPAKQPLLLWFWAPH